MTKPVSQIRGIHARNDYNYTTEDWNLLDIIKPEWIKTMSHTKPNNFDAIKRRYNATIVTRLYHSGFNEHSIIPPNEYIDWAISEVMPNLSPYCDVWQIHNEPDHWGKFEFPGSAQQFNDWYMQVISALRVHYPDAIFVFPGLAVPHDDINYLVSCREAVEASDVLGTHSYWQNPTYSEYNHLSPNWGLRFEQYHALFPDKPILVLEAGNSNHQNGYQVREDMIAKEFVEWFNKLTEYDYIQGAMPFIASSPDPNWENFAWMAMDGRKKQVAYDVGNLA